MLTGIPWLRDVIFRAVVLFLYTGVLLWLSLAPRLPRLPVGVFSWDKLLHALAYLFLTLLAGWTLVLVARSPLRAWIGAFLVAVLFGALMELAQGMISIVRQADFLDLVANTVGALAALVTVPILSRLGAHIFEPRPSNTKKAIPDP